jgi:hypothetical protein
MRWRGGAWLFIVIALPACTRDLDQDAFRREAEKAYMDAHPGWGIGRREGMVTTFVRGDQIDKLDTRPMFDAYKQSGKSGGAFLSGWAEQQEKEAKARRRTLGQAKNDVIPILKSASWMRVQDLGAIGPKDLQDRIRPWRKEIAKDVFVLLGIPEEKLGFRFASIEEVKESKEESADGWVDHAIVNLAKKVGTSTANEMRGQGDRLLVHDLSGVDDVSGLILDPKFREKMLDRFQRDELGAAAPIRNVLIVFDDTDFTTTKPIRARTHQLYDTQNHPGFRGLLRFDRQGLSILEPANPEEKKKPTE